MPETKTFRIGDVLSITTGRLVSHDHIGGVYNILDWMTGESLMTHQLGRAMDACKPVLLKVFPQLAQIELPAYLQNPKTEDPDAIFTWVDTQGELYGEHWEVPKLEDGVYDAQDPIEELFKLRGRLVRDHD